MFRSIGEDGEWGSPELQNKTYDFNPIFISLILSRLFKSWRIDYTITIQNQQ